MKHGIIFDLDGTLVDSLPGIAATLNRSLKAHGLPGHSLDAVRSFVGDGLRTLVARSVPAGSDPEQIQSIVTLFKKDYELCWKQGTKPFPGILNLLLELQQNGHPLAILSNKTHAATETIVQSTFPSIHFTAILGQQEGVPLKPDPTSVLRITDRFGLPPARCALVGDSSIDIETATNAGITPFGVAWGYHERERLLNAGATSIAENPAELAAMLESPQPEP